MTVPESPLRRCDIVMKGGITSGIVYPSAVRALADHFRFVNVGGTSAGAIAASLTAAAEYRRVTGGGLAGFERLARVPIELAKDNALLGLFKPNTKTRPLFQQLARLAKSTSPRAGAVALLVGSFTGMHAAWAWGPVAASLVVSAALWSTLLGISALACSLALVSVGIIAGAILALWRTVKDAHHVVVSNGYGLSSGIADNEPSDGTVLSVWLSNLLDEVAGLPPNEHLTFGHLWYGRTPTAIDAKHRPIAPLVNLEMVATCLSHGRPYTFPTGTDVFYFRRSVLERCVPRGVVASMADAAGPSIFNADNAVGQLDPYLSMPCDRDLPVVLCARMSLAFPLLLTAVELGAVAYGEMRSEGPRAKPEPCWFADGGLSSNFPIHLFDAPLPRWPTFGINLGTFSASEEANYDASNQSQYVWMPSSNEAGRLEKWTRFSGLGSYLGGAMFGAVKDWNDNVQMKVPGFRDRIVTVKLRKEEGGLNLDMGPDVITPLVARGRAAGELLIQRFSCASDGTFSTPMNWDNHRWVRYRVFASMAQSTLAAFARGYASRQSGDVAYDELLRQAETRHAAPYAWDDGPTSGRARKLTRSAAAYRRWLQRQSADFEQSAPRPQPELVTRARY